MFSSSKLACSTASTSTTFAEVLEFVLHHSDLPEYPAPVCRLLCTSISIRAATAQHCAGRMVACFQPTQHASQQMEKFQRFMTKQGHLLKRLTLPLPDPNSEVKYLTQTPAVAAAAAAAAEAAAAAGVKHATRLQHLLLSPLSPAVLRQVSNCSHLTYLHLSQALGVHSVPAGEEGQPSAEELVLQATAAALSRLTGLRQLELSRELVTWDVVLGATSSLTNLTHLSVHEGTVADASVLQHLPASLQELGICLDTKRDKELLDLSHLTALTLMTPGGRARQISLQEGDMLPPNVEVLQLAYNDRIKPLIGLARLRELSMEPCSLRATELQALSDLQAVTGVKLAYVDWESAWWGAAAWSKIPLVSLWVYAGIGSEGPTPATLRQLGKATSLTCLGLGATCRTWDGSVSDLAAALRQVRLLQDLSLSIIRHDVQPAAGAAPAGGAAALNAAFRLSLQQQEPDWCMVAHVITDLPLLRVLHFDGLPLDGLAGKQLAVTPQLELLRLTGRYGFEVLLCLLHSCEGLRHLQTSNTAGMSDAVLSIIARQLHCLTRLDLSHNSGFTDAGIARLSRLQQLQCVHVDGLARALVK